MNRYIVLAAIATPLVAPQPVLAQTSHPSASEDRLLAALSRAEKALEETNAAARELSAQIAILKSQVPPQTGAVSIPKSATALRPPTPGHPEIDRPKSMPACGATMPPNSIGEWLLPAARKKQKKEATHDENEDTDYGINAFVYHCLGLTRASDYEAITNLSLQFTGTKGNDQAEIVIGRTARAVKAARMKPAPDNTDAVGSDGKIDALTTTYNKYRLGGFGRTGSNGEVPLIDLTTSNFASGVGVLASFEWGRSRPVPISGLRSSVNKGVEFARGECWQANHTFTPSIPVSQQDEPREALDPYAKCSGDELVKWMSNRARANAYWSSIISSLWGYKKEPESFAGIEGRYAFQDLSYRPVMDPATGAVITTTLPATVKLHPEPYSVKLYGGFNRPVGPVAHRVATMGLTGSLTYRREVDFIDGTAGKTLCTPATPGATFDICSTDQRLAAPYDTRGFVAGAAFDVQFDRFWYFPPIATSPRLTYAFDTKRFGVEVPLYLLTDADGKLNSGLKYTCRFRGETPEGLELRKSCNINLFIGTSFTMGRAP